MDDRPFKVGDRVFAKRTIDGVIPQCATGTVVRCGGMIGVDWGHINAMLHSCGDRCPNGTGWFVLPTEIAHLDAPPPIDPTQFLSLLKGGSYA